MQQHHSPAPTVVLGRQHPELLCAYLTVSHIVIRPFQRLEPYIIKYADVTTATGGLRSGPGGSG